MVNTSVIRVAAALILTSALAAQAQHLPVKTFQRQMAADDLVFARLHTLVLVNFNHTPLNQAITALSKAAGVNVYVDWHSLKAVGLDKSMPVNLPSTRIGCVPGLRPRVRSNGLSLIGEAWVRPADFRS